MYANFVKMITSIYPDAIYNKDFTLKPDEEGHTVIDQWNKLKLGEKPNIKILHSHYMNMVKEKKEMLPAFDDSDPAPWLNIPEKKENIRIAKEKEIHIPIVNFDPVTGFLISNMGDKNNGQ